MAEQLNSGFITDDNEKTGYKSASGFITDNSNAESGFVTNNSASDNNSSNNSQQSDFQNFTDTLLSTSGAMSDLYRRKYNTGKIEIVKRIKSKFKDDSTYKKLFKQEFDNLDGLIHENIVRTTRFDEDSQGLWYSMEYVDGKTLSQVISDNDIQNDDDKIFILRQVLEGLKYIHNKGLVHRDLKPDNIMVSNRTRSVKIIDFGLAVSDSFEDKLKVAGTPKYMSPEQKVNSSVIDQQSEIYSFGLIMAEFLTGKYPENHDSTGITNSQFKSVVDKCLKQNKSERYKNCSEILFDLKTQLHIIPDDILKLIDDIVEDGVVTPNERASLDSSVKLYNLDKELVESQLNYQLEKVREKLNKKKSRQKFLLFAFAAILVAGLIFLLFTKFIGNKTENQLVDDSKVENKTDEIQQETVETATVYKITTDGYATTNPVEAKQGESVNYQVVDRTNEGFEIKSLNLDGKTISMSDFSGTFTMPDHDVKIAVVYEKIQQQTENQTDNHSNSGNNNSRNNNRNSNNLAYGNFTGRISNGQPNGNGTLIYTDEHLLSQYDDLKRVAKPGDKVTGDFQNGNLVQGTIYRADGSSEFLLIGGL